MLSLRHWALNPKPHWASSLASFDPPGFTPLRVTKPERQMNLARGLPQRKVMKEKASPRCLGNLSSAADESRKRPFAANWAAPTRRALRRPRNCLEGRGGVGGLVS